MLTYTYESQNGPHFNINKTVTLAANQCVYHSDFKYIVISMPVSRDGCDKLILLVGPITTITHHTNMLPYNSIGKSVRLIF